MKLLKPDHTHARVLALFPLELQPTSPAVPMPLFTYSYQISTISDVEFRVACEQKSEITRSAALVWGNFVYSFSGKWSIGVCSNCTRFDQHVARQQICIHGPTRNNRRSCGSYVVRATPSAGNGPMKSQSDTWHVFSVWSAPCNNRGAMFSVRSPCREDIRKHGNGNWLPPVETGSNTSTVTLRVVGGDERGSLKS
jgi:hypothetical protein